MRRWQHTQCRDVNDSCHLCYPGGDIARSFRNDLDRDG
jgi:hypothetical protein